MTGTYLTHRKDTDTILGISYHHFGFMVRMFLATHLASSRLIEDCREGLPGDQVKLVPTSPNHPSRKFRVIQLWDKDGSIANVEAIENNKTALTPFLNRDERASNRRRWPAHRKSPLRVDLVEEARKEEEEFQQLLNEVGQYRAKRPEWECGADGLDSLPGESFKEYRARVRPVLHQQW
jgi:hypothetical protein